MHASGPPRHVCSSARTLGDRPVDELAERGDYALETRNGHTRLDESGEHDSGRTVATVDLQLDPPPLCATLGSRGDSPRLAGDDEGLECLVIRLQRPDGVARAEQRVAQLARGTSRRDASAMHDDDTIAEV